MVENSLAHAPPLSVFFSLEIIRNRGVSAQTRPLCKDANDIVTDIVGYPVAARDATKNRGDCSCESDIVGPEIGWCACDDQRPRAQHKWRRAWVLCFVGKENGGDPGVCCR